MATITLGTNGTTTLTALSWNSSLVLSQPTDLATIVEGIKRQATNVTPQITSGAFNGATGMLHFPGRRGFVNLLPGDFIAYDLVGWPVIVSAYSIANSGGWTHS